MNYERIISKGVKIGLYLTLLTPLVIAPTGLTLSAYPKAVFFRSLIEITFVLYLVLIILNKKYLPRISLAAWSFLIFVSVLVLTSFTGINFYRSLFGALERSEGLIMFFHLLAFFFMFSGMFFDKKQWFRIFKFSAGVSGLVSFVAVLQKLKVWHFYGVSLPGRVSGTLSNPDFFGPYIVLSMFLVLFVLLVEKEKDLRVVWIVVLFLHFLTLILSRTRGAWAALGLSLLVFFFLWFFKYSVSAVWRKRVIIFVLFLSLVLLFLVLNKDAIQNSLLKRALSVFNFSFGSRGDVWKIAIEAWKDRPVFGWGPESFSYIFYKYFKADYLSEIPESMYFDYAHNKIMNMLATTGILGLASWLFLLGSSFFLVLKKKILERKLALVIFVFLSAYFFQCLTVFDTISVYILFFLVLAFINVFSGRQIAIKKLYLIILSVPLIIASLLSFYFVNIKPAVASKAFPQNIKYEETDPVRAVSEYSKASRNTIYYKDLSLVAVERGLLLLEKGGLNKEIAEIIFKKKNVLKDLLIKPDIRPADFMEALARIYKWHYMASGSLEDLNEMERILNQAIEFNPDRPEFYGLMGELRLLQGEEDKAKEFFKKRAKLFPDEDFKYYHGIGSAFVKMGDKKRAAPYLKKAVEAIEDPEEKDINFIESVAVLYCREMGDLENCKYLYNILIDSFLDYRSVFQERLQYFLNK